MSTSKSYRDYILDKLSFLDHVVCKPMMGEYLLYFNGIIFGGIYDDNFLVKKTHSNKKYTMREIIPYNNAKPMYLIEDVDEECLKSIVLDTYSDLVK